MAFMTKKFSLFYDDLFLGLTGKYDLFVFHVRLSSQSILKVSVVPSLSFKAKQNLGIVTSVYDKRYVIYTS